ncbi:unnamed protein product [Macrosiphum euphorbiae]|uniref:DUF5641 domain-containing protein n=1 Tax=Macrosiphum euphorbiae TaxID=13131 RepID=A0AAV0XEP1_9HEMI|nr:unnamed protein product [Macrosiphum euphorbiae]
MAPTDQQEKERVERSLQRAIVKRDKHVNQMLILFNLSKTVESDPSSLPMFNARKRDLEALMSDFRLDQDDVMDQMVELGRIEDFISEHSIIETVVTEQYYSIQAVAGAVACCKLDTVTRSASRVLDSSTKRLFEADQGAHHLPTLNDLLIFIQSRCKILQNSSMSDAERKPAAFTRRKPVMSRSSLLAATKEQDPHCYACQGTHYVYKCEKFKGLTTSARFQLVKSNNMCSNCLSGSHTASTCPSKYSCRTCSGKHHSLLHFESRKRQAGTNPINHAPAVPSSSAAPVGNLPSTDDTSFVGTVSSGNLSVLGTAVIRMCNQQGQWVPVRALIDCGSQISAITTKCATRLGLTRCNRKINVVGLSQSPVVQAKGVVLCSIVPHMRLDRKLSCEPVLLSKITGLMPSKVLDLSIRTQYMGLELTDPNFDRPGQIEFLLGADVYNHIFTDGYHVRHTPGLPSAFETTLGWIIVGAAAASSTLSSPVSLSLTTEPSLKQLLNRFWEVEEPVILWKNAYEWDQPINDELASSWNSFSRQLPSVSQVKIRRHIPIEQCTDVQLLGFSDASQKGYAAVVYMRLSYASRPGTVHLLTARSKVAPLKNNRLDESLSIPRLELCGALLLAQTLHRVQNALSSITHISSIHAWTDSTVVLSWLTTQQVTFKVFVTNRLNKIGELLPSGHWRYVPSMQNPADCVSRGLLPTEALEHSLYWDGPSFVQQSPDTWKSPQYEKIPVAELPEQKTVAETLHVIVTPTANDEWLEKFSSLTRLKRVVAYMRRFIINARHKSLQRKPTHQCDDHPPMNTGFLRYEELRDALQTLVQITQRIHFSQLLKLISSSSSSIKPQYLRLLQVRSKWYHAQPNVTLGDLVLVQAPNLPPTLWKMGRVEAVHPGEDGVVRVVTLRTSDGTLKRPVVKLARLPIN